MNKQQTKKPAAPAQVTQAQAPVLLGAQHGYLFQGESVTLNAELQLPAYLSRGDYSLELWACESPCEPVDGTATGLADPAKQPGAHRVAALATHLPTPLSPLLHRVEGDTSAQLPVGQASHAMALALVQEHVKGERVVVDVANYSLREAFPAPRLEGEISYEVEGNEVVLRAHSVANPRATGNQSGTLALELWAFPTDVESTSASGVPLASAQLAPISGGYMMSPVVTRTSLKRPAPGQWRTAMLLREWTAANGYVTRDQRSTANLDLRTPVASKTPSATPVSSPVAVQPEAQTKPAAAPKAPAQRESAAPTALVSLQTASLEELAQLTGLNARIAKEIVKARPLKSWSDVLKVRGVGEATVQKLKAIAVL
jgi:DNA uptake protein ComE-like DNA-binding protein